MKMNNKKTASKPHYRVVAGVVSNTAGEVLCVRKGVTRFAYTSHRWEFPGGKIEPGESPEQALRRELMEELRLNVEVGDRIITVEHHYEDFSLTMAAYRCQARNPEGITLREHEAMLWLPPKQLAALTWCAADVPIAQAAAD